MKKLVYLLFFIASLTTVKAQYIIVDQDTLFGNEWINFSQTYLKIKVAEDGIYRVSHQVLSDANVPLSQVQGENFQLWHNGQQVPIYTTSNGNFGSNDYLEFYGQKNTSELDRFLFADPDSMMMNPLYSLVTDTAAYFLTWVNNGGNLRFNDLPNQLSNLPTKENYYMADFQLVYKDIVRKEASVLGISKSDYNMSEGFSTEISNISNFNLTPTSIYSNGPDAKLYLRFAGYHGQHEQAVSLNSNLLFTSTFEGNQVQLVELTVPVAQLSTSMPLKIQGMLSGTDYNRVSIIRLNYPRQFNFENKKVYSFTIEASNEVKYLEIQNFNLSSGEAILYDITTGSRMAGVSESGIIKFALPAYSSERDFLLVNSNDGFKQVSNFVASNFVDYGGLNHDFVIVTSKRLNSDISGTNQVAEYANYRASLNGGGHNPIIVEVENLYDQFSWGVERHPFSVRNFALYIKKKWSEARYFFIIGKGMEYRLIRNSSSLSTAYNEGFTVPTYSFPGSDNLLLAGSDGFTPVIPLGRLAAQNANDIKTYLEKVKEFENNQNLPQTIPDRVWMKKALHLGGGNGAILSEQLEIRANLEALAANLESGKVGAKVKGFYKTSTDPIQQSQTEDIFSNINSGVSFLTFFGHSAPGVFDFSIDFPDNWKNKGKYPVMMSLGCYSGNIHLSGKGIGERFLFLKDAGSILFGATSGQGYINSLNSFANVVYNELGGDLYGESYGKVLQEAVSSFNAGNYGLDLVRQQFNLLGDPSIKINPLPGPDYTIDQSTLKFHPEQVSVGLDSFSIDFDVVNIGQNNPDSAYLKIEHQLPDNSRIVVVDELVPLPGNRSAFSFKIPVPGKKSSGQNTFYIKIDAADSVEELPSPAAEQNNELLNSNGQPGVRLFIRDNSAIPAFPPDFGIAAADVTLKAYTSDPLAPTRKYVLQFDTTELFNSQWLQTHNITQSGGVLAWKPNVPLQDEVVYYWRVSPDSLSPTEGFNWNYSSFLCKNDGTTGWNQSHYYQFKKDDFVNMELEGHGQFSFIQNLKDVCIKDAVVSIESPDARLNNAGLGRYWGTPDAGVYVLWFDSTYKSPQINYPPGQGPISYGLPHPWGIESYTFIFSTTTQNGRKQLIDFLTDVVPLGDYVVFYTIQGSLTSDYMPQSWASDSISYGTNLYQILEQDGGATHVRQLEDLGSVPYAIGYKKGQGVIAEEIASNKQEVINLLFTLNGNWDKGYVKSSKIGPASEWNSLVWKNSTIDDYV
ncbi:MAG: hypothetical protein IT258_18790, partial [Saprospiraceae bacterium]|nr:hypothetical protein [Saprospiraceae bacterium]